MPGIFPLGWGPGARWVLESPTGPTAPFRRAKEPVHSFPRSHRSRAISGTGRGPSGHPMSLGPGTIAALLIWQRQTAQASTPRNVSSNP